MESVGLVIGSDGSRCEILVQSEKVELGSIVEIGTHFGIISSMRYSEDKKVGARQRLTASCQIFGRIDDKKLHVIKRPIEPSARVILADEQKLEEILKRKSSISIGRVLGTGARAYLNAEEFDRHMAILASTGAGKSYITANFVKEYASLGLPTLIVDPHGEYSNLLGKLAQGGGFQTKTYTVKSSRAGFERLIIPLSDLEASDFHHFMNLSEPQETALGIILEKLSGTEYLFDQMIEQCRKLDESVVHEATMQALARKLLHLKKISKGVFDLVGSDVSGLFEPYQVTIIDTSMAAQGIRRSVISYLSKQILSAKIAFETQAEGQKIEYPLLFVVEEAHNFAGANVVHSCKGQLRRIASEGRKFGIGLIVISQKPSKIDEEILSQCNTGVYMHITNPRDKDHIRKSFECITEDIVGGLDSLNVGECIIAGPLLDIPFLMCEVDRIEIEKDRRSKFDFRKPQKPKTAGFGYI